MSVGIREDVPLVDGADAIGLRVRLRDGESDHTRHDGDGLRHENLPR
jgi:hypothetical protein